MQVVLNEHGTDRRYEDYPSAVITQYYDKDGKPLGVSQTMEFLTLASYLLWVIDITTTHIPLSEEYSKFAYFVATRQYGAENALILENQYVRRSYTLVK